MSGPGSIRNTTKTVSGSLAADGHIITQDCEGFSSAVAIFPVVAVFSGTIVFELSWNRGTTWVGVPARRIDSLATNPSTSITTVSTATVYMVDTFGATNVRLRVSTYTSGSANGLLLCSTVYTQETVSLAAGNQQIGSIIGTNTPSDTDANPTAALDSISKLQGWNASNNQWRRILSQQAGTDGVSGAFNLLGVAAYLYAFNGSTFDRLRSDTSFGLDVDVTRLPASDSATVNTVNATATPSATLFAANSSAKGRILYNDADKVLYWKKGGSATSTDHTWRLPIGGMYEFPQPIYRGIVTGVWVAGVTGNARVTEW